MFANSQYMTWRNSTPPAFADQHKFDVKIPVQNSWERSKRRVLLVIEHVDTEDLKGKKLLKDGPSSHWVKSAMDLGMDYAAHLNPKLPALAAINFQFFKTYDLDDTAQHQAREVAAARVRSWIDKIKPTDVIVFGDDAAVALMAGFVKDERTLLLRRGRPIKHEGIHWTSTISLSRAYQGKAADMDDDTDEQENLIDHANLLGFVSQCVGNALVRDLVYKIECAPAIKYVDSLRKFDWLFKRLMAADKVALDTETTGLGRIVNDVLTLQFSFDATASYIVPLDHMDATWTAEEKDHIERHLRKFFMRKFDPLSKNYGQYMIGQNLKFDLTIVRQRFKINHIQWRVWDLMAGEYGLDENRKALSKCRTPLSGRLSPYTLEWMAAWYGCDFYAVNAFSKDDRVTITTRSLKEPGVLEYCAQDSAICFPIHEAQQARAKNRLVKNVPYLKAYNKFIVAQMSNLVQIESVMEHRGDQLDMPWLLKLKDVNGPLTTVRRELETEFKTFKTVQRANKLLAAKAHLPTTTIFGAAPWIFSVTKPEHKQQLFIRQMKLEPLAYGKSGDAKIDKFFQEAYKDLPEINVFTQLSQLGSLKGTYVNGFYDKMKEDPDMRVDFRIRPGFGFTGTVTGRSNSYNPNLQNIPARGKFAKLVKRMFVAPRGCLTVKLDYCVDGTALIPTSKGLVALNSLGAKELKKPVTIDLPTLSVGGKNKAASVVYMGKKPTLTLTTKSHNKLSVTHKHEMQVLRDGDLVMVEAQSCVLGDYMCLSSASITRTTKQRLDLPSVTTQANNTSGHTNIYVASKTTWRIKIKVPGERGVYYEKKDFTSIDEAVKARDAYYRKHKLAINRSLAELVKPKEMTSDLAWLLGAIVSEGHINLSSNVVFFTNSNKVFIDAFAKKFAAVFGPHINSTVKTKAGVEKLVNGVVWKNNYDHYELKFRSKELIVWLTSLGVYSQLGRRNNKTASHYKRVPDCILQASKENQLAFLGVYLEADGHIEQGKALRWSSTSYYVISGLKAILDSYGFITSVTGLSKTTKTLSLGQKHSRLLWVQGLKNHVVSKTMYASDARSSRLGILPVAVSSSMTATQLKAFYRAKCYISPLVSVADGGLRDVYDLTMQDTSRPSFVANGMLVHNCAHEVRVWGIVAEDAALCELFVNGRWLRQTYRRTGNSAYKILMDTDGDIHKINSQTFFGVKTSEVTAEQRNSVKSIVFGAIYGRGAKAISVQAKSTVEIIKTVLEKFFKRFIKASGWLETAKKHAVEHGYMFSPIMRLRNMFTQFYGRDNLIAATERRGCNAPIQGFAADIGHTAALLYQYHIEQVVRKFKLEKSKVLRVGVNSFIHDAIKTDAPYEYMLVCMQVLSWCATTGVMDYYKTHWGIKFPVEIEVEFELAAHDETHWKWDWHEGNGQTLDKGKLVGGVCSSLFAKR